MEFDEAQRQALAFRDLRDWKQFHNPKDLAISLSLEASELLECFQWSGTDLSGSKKKADIRAELADVLIYAIYIADTMEIDIPDAISQKLEKNGAKYPVETSRGISKKYTELTSRDRN